MRSIFDFIVKPVGERYDNSKKIGDKELVLNTKIESFKFVNNIAEVIAVPLVLKTNIKVGDKVVIHHNVFRRFYDIRGDQKNSRAYYKEDMYFVTDDQIYLYGEPNKWTTNRERCFVKPLKNKNTFSLDKEQKHIGVLKYGNESLDKLGVNVGDFVGFKPNSEFEFIIDGQRLYCMKSNDIVIKYGHKGDETEYNPSWAQSGIGADKGS
jgi:hypothetical protein